MSNSNSFQKTIIQTFSIVSVSFFISCATPNKDPDLAVGGTLTGAAIGSGAGAVVGNQVATAGAGVAIGAGIGAVQGLSTGIALDSLESELALQKDELLTLRAELNKNEKTLRDAARFSDASSFSEPHATPLTLYFDEDATSLQSGGVQLIKEFISPFVKDPGFRRFIVTGNADDSGTAELNKKLAHLRALEVAKILSASGIPSDQIEVKNAGAEFPILSNSTKAGREANRRVTVAVK